jgi:protein-tyrosine phosphatase
MSEKRVELKKSTSIIVGERIVKKRVDAVDVERMLTERNGRVLGVDTLLKVDFQSRIPRNILGQMCSLSGAPAFRVVSSDSGVYAMGQPTVTGVKTVVNWLRVRARNQQNECETRVGKSDEIFERRRKSVEKSAVEKNAVENECQKDVELFWLNLREEPFLYINGRPFVLREVASPFRNVGAYSGVSVERLESMEERLRLDVLEQSSLSSGNFLVHIEVAEGVLVPTWEFVADDALSTSRSVSDALVARGDERLRYARVPMTSHCAPRVQDMDALVEHVRAQPLDACIVLQDGSGRGRSTTAMIVASLVRLRLQSRMLGDARNAADSPAMARMSSSASASSSAVGAARTRRASSMNLARSSASARGNPDSADDHDRLAAHRRGDYSIVLALLAMLEHGVEAKRVVDAVVDDCALIMNVRNVIVDQKLRAERARAKESAALHTRQAVVRLHRYFLLIAFAGYLQEIAELNGSTTFRRWLDAKGSIAALSEQLASTARLSDDALLKKGAADAVLSVPSYALLERQFGSLLSQRTGSVLGANALLKADHVPVGSRNRRDRRRAMHGIIDVGAGATMFRGVALHDWRIFGVAMPSIEGLHSVARYITSSSSATDDRPYIAWVNLREEPIVYLDRAPYVLRDVSTPLRNVQLVGISSEQVERLEHRLVDDVRNELRRFGGRILVHEETRDGTLEATWCAPRAEQVRTVDQLYEAALQVDVAAHVDLHYWRVPLSSESAPSAERIDRIVGVLCALPEGANIVFNCHSGAGRSTLGMSIAALYCLHRVRRKVQQMRTPKPMRRHGGGGGDASSAKLSASAPKRSSELDGRSALSVVGGHSRALSDAQLASLIAAETVHDVDDGGAVSLLDVMHAPRSLMSSPRRVADDAGGGDAGDDAGSDRRSGDVGGDNDDGDEDDDVDDDRDAVPKGVRAARERRGEFDVIRSLIRLIPRGQSIKAQVDAMLDSLSHIAHLRHDIFVMKVRAETAGTEQLARVYRERCRSSLERYFMLIAFNAFLNLSSPPPSSFSEWLGEQREFEMLRRKFSDAELIDEAIEYWEPNAAADTPADVLVAQRSGDMLTAGSVVKIDHFLALARKGLDSVPGAPNFRKVSSFCIYGTAMPTLSGITAVLDLLGASPGTSSVLSSSSQLVGAAGSSMGSGGCLWVSLREEPIVYVNGRPLVLRNIDKPYSNIVNTGIDAERVEQQELRLKRDLLAEAEANDGHVLIHDENAAGELIGVREHVSPHSIVTPREAYTLLAKEGWAVEYFRCPITDEQTPEEQDFDELLDIVTRTRMQHIVGNCQMGRGRTSTFLIMCTLVATRRDELPSADVVDASSSSSSSATDSIDEQQRYHRGNYALIQRLARVLPNGPRIKRWVDTCIDMNSTMQNLREAIYAHKDRSDTLEQGSSSQVRATEMGINYLIRYFYLIAFGAFLRDPSVHLEAHANRSFEQWMDTHAELRSLLDRSVISLQ